MNTGLGVGYGAAFITEIPFSGEIMIVSRTFDRIQWRWKQQPVDRPIPTPFDSAGPPYTCDQVRRIIELGTGRWVLPSDMMYQ